MVVQHKLGAKEAARKKGHKRATSERRFSSEHGMPRTFLAGKSPERPQAAKVTPIAWIVELIQ